MNFKKIRFALVSTLVAFTLPLSSCLKKENLDEDTDAPIPAENFQKALIDAYVEDDSYSMKKGETVTYLITQTFEETKTRSIRSESYEVIEKVLDSENQKLFYNIILGDEDLVKNTQKTTESIQIVLPNVEQSLVTTSYVNNQLGSSEPKSNVLSNLLEKSTKSTQGVSLYNSQNVLRLFSPRLFYSLFLICGSDENQSCHNLKTETELLMAPAKVIASNNCKPGSDCRLRTKKISFDFVSLDAENKKQKVNISVRISNDTPYLGKILEFCQKTLVPYNENNQKVLVEICQTINDYKFGSDSVTP